jgi:hypothetical protein
MASRKPPNIELGRLLTASMPPGHRKRIAKEIGTSERTLARILSGYTPPQEALLLKLQKRLKIPDERMERVRDGGADSYLRHAFNWYRSNRQIILPVAREYYSGVPGVLAFPIVTKNEWLPKQPVSLADVDRHLFFLTDEEEPPVRQLRLLGNRTFSEFVWSTAKDVRLSRDFVYRLIKTEIDGTTVKLTFGPTRYHHFVNSCEAIQFELGEWCCRNEAAPRRPRTNGADLRIRGPNINIFDLNSRICSTGICVALLILNTRKGHVFYVHERSSNEVMEGPSGFSLVPGGTFQPDSAEDVNHERDFSLMRTVIRELAEELLGMGEIEQTIRTGDDFYEHDRIRPFLTALDQGHARAFFLGIGVSPGNMKPMILATLVIDSTHFDETALKFEDNFEGKFIQVPLTKLVEWSKHRDMSSDGATCLHLVHRHLEYLIDR